MPISADLLLDTSAAIALAQPNHSAHEAVIGRVRGLTLGLAGHAAVETYSVLTRLPGSQRVSGEVAARIIGRNFPATHHLSGETDVLSALSSAGIAGGASYDGIVALAAKDAGVRLLTCDRRAMTTYARLGVDVDVV